MKITKFGEALRRLRVEAGHELLLAMAMRLGVTPSFLSQIEHGRKAPPVELVEKVVRAYSLTAEKAAMIRAAAIEARGNGQFNVTSADEAKTASLLESAFARLSPKQHQSIQDILRGNDP